MSNFKIVECHINEIKAGDTVEHNQKMMTVCQKDIKYDSWDGTSLFGDCYKLGTQKVKRIIFVLKEGE